MSGLNELKVSLTKNGFQKIADVIIRHPRHEILKNLNGVYPDINLDRGQIINMLSGNPDTEEFPDVWDDIRTFGDDQVRALTFVAILYSHNLLITTFAKSKTGEMRGTLHRNALGNEKAYTNIAYTMQSFGICAYRPGAQYIDYSMATIFSNMRIGPLAKKIINKKLEQTGWREPPPNDEFRRSFYEQCFYYRFHDALALTPGQFESWLEGRVVEVSVPPPMTLPDAYATVSAKLVAALSSKPFVILCGASGTGKTTGIRQLVSALSPANVDRRANHAFIPVEAGWTDGRHLLGYKNPFGTDGEYYAWTPVIEVLLKANYDDYSSIPFFIILDEMNLSYVEMYFSRFLSIMETASSDTPEPVIDRETLQLMLRSGMLDAEQANMAEAAVRKGGLYLSRNVFIVGTVNIDETTHSFSPKVLDRAFVIEVTCGAPSLHNADYVIPDEDKLVMPARDVAAILIGNGVGVAPEDADFNIFLDAVFERLGAFRFGPRVTKEIKRHIAVTMKIAAAAGSPVGFASPSEMRDRLLMQKILPKFSGNRTQLGKVLEQLLLMDGMRELILTTRKLETMKNGLGPLGTVSFFS
ncbi:McrB family protein [Undibacterium sp. RuRC25W]|uniref:McrB family protein n=1 Tax=Undibacterium sp. RuRC25W TaxID=3413047 RepID=UPI003BF2C243